MPRAETRPEHPPNMFLDLMEAIANRHGEVDLRLDHVTMRLPMIRDTIELNGQISISVHLRELTEKERAASASHEVRVLER
jgi:hypothetical protein